MITTSTLMYLYLVGTSPSLVYCTYKVTKWTICKSVSGLKTIICKNKSLDESKTM